MVIIDQVIVARWHVHDHRDLQEIMEREKAKKTARGDPDDSVTNKIVVAGGDITGVPEKA